MFTRAKKVAATLHNIWYTDFAVLNICGLTILDAALVFGAPGGFAQSGIGGRSQWAVVVGAFKAGTEFI